MKKAKVLFSVIALMVLAGCSAQSTICTSVAPYLGFLGGAICSPSATPTPAAK